MADTVGFVERLSKLTGALFFQTLTLGFLDKPDASLSELTEISYELGVTITKQGLQARLENAVPFLTELFPQAMGLFRNQGPLELKTPHQLAAIFLTDSSTGALPEALKGEFPGCGGAGPEAAVKIQFPFDFLHGAMAGFGWQAGRSPDQAYTGELQAITRGAVYLSDLGYFVLSRFRTRDDHHAHFLSRFDTQPALLTPTGAPFDLFTWLRAHPEAQFEQDVIIGSHERLPCRRVVGRVPQDVADARRRQA